MITERKIQLIIRDNIPGRAHIPNIYFNDKWEADLIIITSDNQIVEYEAKTSKWDYMNDFKKANKHGELSRCQDFSMIPNKFYYVCEEKMAGEIDIPEYAGLIIIQKKGMTATTKIVKKAPQLHNERIDHNKWESIAMKLANRMFD